MQRNLAEDLAMLRIDRSSPLPAVDRRRWVAGAVALSAVLVISLGITGIRLSDRLRRPAVRIGEVEAVSPSQADVKVTASGYVVPQHKSIIASRRPGRLDRVAAVEGQVVTRGQLLATLESEELEAALAEAEAARATAKARAAAARAAANDAVRAHRIEQQLLESKSTTQANADAARWRMTVAIANWKAAKAEVEVANARAQNAEARLEETRIVAPFAGTVVRKLAEAGEVPLAGIVELVDFDSLMVEADVSESQIASIHLDDPAEVTLDAYPGRRQRAKVAEIRRTVEKQKATVLVKLRFVDEAPDVFPQMAAHALFLSKPISAEAMKAPAKVIVPWSAVVERRGETGVFVVKEGHARLVPLVLGDRMGQAVEVRRGVVPGTKIVLEPPDSLGDGDAVTEKKAG